MKGKKRISKILAIVCAIALFLTAVEWPAFSFISKASADYTVVDVKNYTGKDAETYTGAANEIINLTAGTGTLDGIMIDGIFNLTKYSSVLFGSSAHPKNRFQIGVTNQYALYLQYVNTAGSVTRETLDSTYVGKDVRMQIAFTFANKNESAGTADVTMKVKIANTLEKEVTATGANMAQLANAMYVCPNTGTVTLKTMATTKTVDVSAYTEEAEKSYTGAAGQIQTLTAGEGTLEGVLVDGIFNLARYSSVLFGSSGHPNNRFQIGVNNGSVMYAQYIDRAGNVKAETFGNTYVGKDTRMQIGFVFTNKNETAGTADVVIKIKIGTEAVREIVATGANMAQLANAMYALPNTGSITLKTAQPRTTVNVKNYTGKDEQTYTGAAAQVQALNAGEGTLDGLLIDGIYNISRYSSIMFGAGAHPNNRFQIGVNNASKLYFQFIDRAGNTTNKTYDSTYVGKSTRMQVGFVFVNKNETAGTADVIITVNIADDIKEELYITGANMAQLANAMYVLPNTGTVTITAAPGAEPDEPEQEPDPNFAYTEIGVETLTGQDEATYTTEVKAGNNSAYEEILVDGVYNFTGNAAVYFGTAGWYGLRINLDGANLKYWIADKGSKHDKSVTPAEAGVTEFAGKDVRIKVGIRTVKTNQDGTVNMEYKVCIGEYTKAFILKNVDKASFVYIQRLHIVPGTGSVTIKKVPAPVEPEFEYEEMDVKALTGADSVTYTAETRPGNNGSWDGKMVDGIYTFTSNACVYFGTADWYGLRMQLDGTGLKYWIAPAGSAHDATITPAQAGMTEFAGKEIRIKVGIHTVSTNQDGTVNLGYKVCIGEYETKFTIANVNKTQFQVSQRLHIVPGSGNVVVKTAVPPQEPEDEVDPTFEYEVVDVATLTLEDEVTYTGAEGKPGNNNVIEGQMLDGIFNITGNGGVYFGTAGWYGLKVQLDGTGLKYWVAPDGSTSDKTITPAQAGMTEFAGKDVRIKVGIRTVRTNQDGTANMEYKICIGEYTDAFILKNVNKATFLYAQRLHVVPGTGSVTVKTAIEKEPEKPIPTDITYEQTLGMKDFTGKDEITYTADTKPSAGDKSLDGVLIDGIYNITGNACIYIGAANWTGMRLELSGTDSLRYRFLPGDLGNKVVSATEAGVEGFAGKDVRIKLGFTFEEGTVTDTKADVIVQVFIGDDYTDTFRIKNVDKSSFVGRMFVYPQTGSVTLKHVKETSNEPQVPEGFVAEYDKTMKFTDFGITADTVVAGGEEKPNGGDTETLHRMMVEGTYRFTGTQSSAYIGSRGWGGLRFGATATEGELTYMFMDLNGKGGLHSTALGSKDTDCQLVDADVRIKAGFTIIKENADDGTVDAVIEVWIGDKYKDTFVVEGVKRTNLIRGMHLYAPEGSSVTLKVDEADLDYKQEPSDKKLSYNDELTFFDFGISRNTTVTNGEARKSAGEGTLDGVSIEGEFYLSGNTIFGFGGAWRGLQFQRGKKGMIYQYLDVDGKGGIYRKEVTEEEVGSPLYDEMLAVKVGFTFANVNKKAGTADVTIEVNLGDDYRDVFTVKGVLIANLQRIMLLYAADGNGYENSKLVLQKPVLEEFKVPSGVKIKYDETMKFTNFGITEDTTVSNGEIKPNGNDKLSIDKVMVDGTYHFSGPQAAVYIGSRGWGGLRFGTTPNGEFTYQFFDNNGKNAMHIMTLLEEDTGCKLIDADVRIKAGFTIIKENKKAKTADVIIEVRIGNQYKEMFLAEGVQTTNLIRGMHVYAGEGSSTTLKVDKGDLHYVNTPDDKVLTYEEELTFFDFGITDDFLVQETQTRKVIPGTLDGVSIEGTYFMTGNATFGFGGDWRGLQFQRGTKGMVYQYLDTDGKGGIYRKEVTAEDTGCALYDADVEIKVGFNFSNVNEKAGTADVTIEVCIGGKYRDVFTVKGVKTANLNRHILLYSADATSGFKGSKMILRKPYMEPFNFKEFGFTKNWKKELRL